MGVPGDEEVARKAECEELPPLLDYLESAIPASGYLVEDRLTFADISVASPFANLKHLNIAIDPARHPKVLAYVERMLARPSFAPMIAQEAAFLERTAA
jgi:glutathione S-transferase